MRSADDLELPISARALDQILNEGGKAAAAIRSKFHRTMLWRWRTGRQLPDAEGISTLHRLSGGRIPAESWARTGTEG